MELGYIDKDDNYFMFNIWVTLECNYACSYCYEGDKKEFCYLNEENADNIIKFIVDMCEKNERDVIWVNFHGGEPMLNVKIIKYIMNELGKYSQIKKIYTGMTTNCSVYDESICDYIKEITVSIDGNKETHDLNRRTKKGDPTYDVAMSNALKYLEKQPDLRLRMVVTPETVGSLCENLIHLYNLGFRLLVPGLDYFSKEWKDEHFEILYNQLVKIQEYRRNNMSGCRIGILDERPKSKSACTVGCDGFQISASGKIYPCTYVVNDDEFLIGNVVDGLDQERIDKINSLNGKSLECCEGCTNYRNCISPRCLMVNKQLTGDYYTASAVVCALEHVKLRLQRLL